MEGPRRSHWRTLALSSLLLAGALALPGALAHASSPPAPSPPPNPYPIIGFIWSSPGVPAVGASIWVNDTTVGGTWVPLTTTSGASGSFQVDLGNDPVAYSNGDTISVQSTYPPLHGSNTTLVNTGSASGYSWCNNTLSAAPLVVGLSVHPSTIFAGQSTTLYGSVSGGLPPHYQYNWTYGDGSPGAITYNAHNTSSHVYTTGGTYTAMLQANSTTPGSVTASATVTVQAVPTLSLPFAPATIQVGSSVRFTPDLTPTYSLPWSYIIEFGDGSNSGYLSSASPVAYHAYAAAGTYTANCTAWDGSTGYRVDSATVSIVVGAGISATLASTPVSPTEVGVATTLTATTANSHSAISSYAFLFGDGASAGPQASASASHTYATSENLTASVTATNSTGAVAAATLPLTVLRHVVLAWGASTLTGPAPLAVAFTAAGFRGLPGSGYTYDFWLGDDTNFTGNTTGATATTYLSAGNYTAEAMVADSLGAMAWQNLTIMVTKSSPPPTLVAHATATPTSGPAKLTVSFSGSASGGVGADNYTWSFGDGTGLGYGTTATHTYARPGVYTAYFNVTDSATPADHASVPLSIDVGAPAALAIAFQGPRGALAGQALLFVVNVTGGLPPYSGIFLWGDGTGGAEFTPTSQSSISEGHTFQTAGTYTVTVFVNDTSSPEQTKSQSIVVVVTAPSSPPPLSSQLLPGGSLFPWLLLLLVLVLVAVLVLLYVRRRRKKEPEEMPPSGAEEAAAGSGAVATAAAAETPAAAPAPAAVADEHAVPQSDFAEHDDSSPIEWDELADDPSPPSGS